MGNARSDLHQSPKVQDPLTCYEFNDQGNIKANHGKAATPSFSEGIETKEIVR